ncbi:MAG: GGDEF domain-containing protein [Actinomycetota bacterium]|nr:GGDEF domain-containing protein [Actinomycetota bacterium]
MSPALHFSGAVRLSRQWWATAIGGGIAVVAIAVLPADSIERSVLARGTEIVASLIFIVTFLTLPKAVRAVWFYLGGYLVLTAIADVIYDYQALILNVSPFPGPADVLYILASALGITGLFLLGRKLNPGADLSSWIDISIMVVAAAGTVGAFVIGPMWTSNGQWNLATVLSLIYPLLDLVLLAALVRLLMLPHARNLAITLLAISMGLFLAYDLIYNNQILAEVWTPFTSMEAVWTAAMLCITLAVLSPGARQFVAAKTTRGAVVTTTRQLLIGVSVLAVPVIVFLELSITGSLVLRLLVPVILILFVLVLTRMHLLLRTSQRQATALAELERTDFLTGLPNRLTWNDHLVSHAASTQSVDDVCAITILHIDDFTRHLETRGQHIGNLLLISAAIAWLEELSADDVIARYGEDEFALLIRRKSITEVQEVLRRVVRAAPQELTITSGAALLRPDENPVEAERRAESAMQAARSGTRPQIDIEQSITT